jgi:excisionase family DNA binding protein
MAEQMLKTAESQGDKLGKKTVTVAEAAELLGISRASAYEGIHTGQIPSIRIGYRILVPLASLNRMLGGTAQGEGE